MINVALILTFFSKHLADVEGWQAIPWLSFLTRANKSVFGIPLMWHTDFFQSSHWIWLKKKKAAVLWSVSLQWLSVIHGQQKPSVASTRRNHQVYIGSSSPMMLLIRSKGKSSLPIRCRDTSCTLYACFEFYDEQQALAYFSEAFRALKKKQSFAIYRPTVFDAGGM